MQLDINLHFGMLDLVLDMSTALVRSQGNKGECS